MLIINADDYGLDRTTTDRILTLYTQNRITSTTAMVFMQDSGRAAQLAQNNNIPVGFHLNFTEPLSQNSIPTRLLKRHETLMAFFLKHKYARVLYAPSLTEDIDYCFKAQYDQFSALYQKSPTHIDGHHHIHLCSNLVFGNILPKGCKLRRSFTFTQKESNLINSMYRKLVDFIIARKHITVHYFTSLGTDDNSIITRLDHVDKMPINYNVELMVHVDIISQYLFLKTDLYFNLISKIPKGSYETL